MNDDYQENLPAALPDLESRRDSRYRVGNPVVLRNPFAAIFKRIGDDTAARSLDSQANVVAALTRLLEAKTKAVEANDRLHAAGEKFQRNRLGLLNPADQEQYEEEKHQRLLAKKRREREQYEADERTFDVKERFDAKVEFKEPKFAAGRARFAQKIAERQVGEAVARSSLEPEPKETPAPEKPVSVAAVLADYVQTLERDIDAGEAAGRPTKQMREDVAALNALLKRL